MTRTKKRTIVFYTEEEIQLIKEYASNNRKDYKNINALARKLKRPRSGMCAKYYRIKREMDSAPTPGRIMRPVLSSPEPKKVMDVPKGMVLEFPASKIHIEEGKVTLYF